jgi:hypothetical protein
VCYTGNGPNAHNNARAIAIVPQMADLIRRLVGRDNGCVYSRDERDARAIVDYLDGKQDTAAALAAERQASVQASYPHMCRDGHAEIGHRDGEHEMCPLCREIAAREQAEREHAQFVPIDRADLDAVSPCGHYMRFRLPWLHEDGSETMSCMQCDRDMAQARAEQAEQERDRLDIALCAAQALLTGPTLWSQAGPAALAVIDAALSPQDGQR